MRMKATLSAASAACLLLCAIGAASADTVVLARNGQSAPSAGGIFVPYDHLNGNYYTFSNPALNSRGQIAFLADLNMSNGAIDPGIFRVDSEEGRIIAQKHLQLPSWDGDFDEFYLPSINSMGQVAFWAKADTGQTGIYTGTGEAWPTQVVREDEPASLGNGYFDEMHKFNLPALDTMGNVAFRAFFKGTDGGVVDESGIVLTQGSVPQDVARESLFVSLKDGYDNVAMSNFGQIAFWARTTGLGGTPTAGIFCGQGANHLLASETLQVPEGANGEFSIFSTRPAIHQGSPFADPTVAFHAYLQNTTGIDDDSGLWVASPATTPSIKSPEEIAHRADSPPDGNGQYDTFSQDISLNGKMATFLARMRNTSNPALDKDGIYRRFYYGTTNNETIKIARGGEPAPGGNGVFSQLFQPVMNDDGQVAFKAALQDTDGDWTDDHAIYIGDGLILVEVAREGDPLLGSTIVRLEFATGPDYRSGFNDHAQVAYRAKLANGWEAQVLTTPLVQWVGENTGGWYENANWTLGIEPAEVHDVLITPDRGVEVSGPRTNSKVKSLTIGLGASNPTTLSLVSGGDVSVVNTCTVMSDGNVEIGAGRTLAAADIVNQGALTFQGGTGNVFGEVANGPGGSIIVPVGTEAWMHDHLHNQGVVDVAPGAEIHLSGLTGNGCSGGGTALLGGEVRPGTSVGIMSFGGDAVFDVRSTTYIEFDRCADLPTLDQIVVEGDLMLDGSLVLDSACTPAWMTPGQRFEIIDVMGTARGRFLGLGQGAQVAIFDGLPLYITYTGGDGNDVELYAVPEPSALVLLCMAVLGFVTCARCKRR